MLRLRTPHRPPGTTGVGAAVGGAAGAAPESPIARDFPDPYLELIRLLNAAAEIEHALLIQYLYAAFSLKQPAYSRVRGSGQANAHDVVGVAIQEMQHLQTVNSMLVDLHAAPSLLTQGMPYEPAIYPFVLHLERMSRFSVAKYVFTEAPAGKLDPDDPANAAELPFINLLDSVLGASRPNHIGSLYTTIIELIPEVVATGAPDLPNLVDWKDALVDVRAEGEGDHFRFFKELFMATHAGFHGKPVWDVADDHPDYPSMPVPVDPSAYEGHEHQIGGDVREVAFLADLQYWIVLILLDLSYRESDGGLFITLAKNHMRETLWALGNHLPTVGAAVPFDPLGIAYSPGVDRAGCLGVLRRLLGESKRLTTAIADHLPQTYPSSTDDDTLGQLQP